MTSTTEAPSRTGQLPTEGDWVARFADEVEAEAAGLPATAAR